jgi:hypothetical protein
MDRGDVLTGLFTTNKFNGIHLYLLVKLPTLVYKITNRKLYQPVNIV